MARIFGKYNFRFWIGGKSDNIRYEEERLQKQPRTPIPPAPTDLFNMVIEAIRKHSLASVEKMERTGDFDNGWKHPIEELLYQGAFSDDQSRALQEVFAEVTNNVAVIHTRILVTRILCGAVEQPKEYGSVSVNTVAQTAAASYISTMPRPKWK